MPSPAEYAANRLKQNSESARNASSPPPASGRTSGRTQEGKARSAMNALRHGLTARVVVLPTEDMDAYQAFAKEIVDSLDPQTPVERQFAQTVADNQWRINRIRSIEDGMLGMGHFEAAGNFDCPSSEIHAAMTAARAFRDGSKAFVNLSIYEQRLHRSMKEALRQLKELQTERCEKNKTEMDDAIRLFKTQQMKGLPSEPEAAPNGNKFVYAGAEIALESARRDRLEDSLLAEKAGFNLAEYNLFREAA
jgi:enoyl-CoA hydratase/carnithine racemase